MRRSAISNARKGLGTSRHISRFAGCSRGATGTAQREIRKKKRALEKGKRAEKRVKKKRVRRIKEKTLRLCRKIGPTTENTSYFVGLYPDHTTWDQTDHCAVCAYALFHICKSITKTAASLFFNKRLSSAQIYLRAWTLINHKEFEQTPSQALRDQPQDPVPTQHVLPEPFVGAGFLPLCPRISLLPSYWRGYLLTLCQGMTSQFEGMGMLMLSSRLLGPRGHNFRLVCPSRRSRCAWVCAWVCLCPTTVTAAVISHTKKPIADGSRRGHTLRHSFDFLTLMEIFLYTVPQIISRLFSWLTKMTPLIYICEISDKFLSLLPRTHIYPTLPLDIKMISVFFIYSQFTLFLVLNYV